MEDLFVPEAIPYKDGAVIKVIGVGGAGGNAVDNMIKAGVSNVEFIAMNTDYKALSKNKAQNKILLSKNGLGAGCRPEVGKASALEYIDAIRSSLNGADMVFITCGLGGGTGTGAAPVIAAAAKSAGILTVAVVYMPRTAEGIKKKQLAEAGLEELKEHVDSYIVVPNDGMQDAGHKKNFFETLRIADDVLRQSVQGIAEMATGSGHMNIDFADVCTAMGERGKSVMGIGRASGENRAKQAFEDALKSPLLADTSIMGSFFVLANITCNIDDFSNDEFEEISALIQEHAGQGAEIKVGVTCDDRVDETLSVTVVATGISGAKKVSPTPSDDPITHINVKLKHSASGEEITSKVRNISRGDRNLRAIGDVSDDMFEIPTYLRKQAD
ncbi:MAG: cell division protein FtsZ [Deferribacterales bacterium]|nr:cell division protein FtsZ [Deferribacterales bacterium]